MGKGKVGENAKWLSPMTKILYQKFRCLEALEPRLMSVSDSAEMAVSVGEFSADSDSLLQQSVLHLNATATAHLAVTARNSSETLRFHQRGRYVV